MINNKLIQPRHEIGLIGHRSKSIRCSVRLGEVQECQFSMIGQDGPFPIQGCRLQLSDMNTMRVVED